MSEVPRIDFALARNHLVAAHRTVILLPLLRIECVNAVMIRCQSIFQSDPSSQNNLIAVFLAARVSLEAILKKAHVQDFGCRILNSAAAMFPELFKLILMVKIQVAKGSDGFRTEYLAVVLACTGNAKNNVQTRIKKHINIFFFFIFVFLLFLILIIAHVLLSV